MAKSVNKNMRVSPPDAVPGVCGWRAGPGERITGGRAGPGERQREGAGPGERTEEGAGPGDRTEGKSLQGWVSVSSFRYQYFNDIRFDTDTFFQHFSLCRTLKMEMLVLLLYIYQSL